MKRVIPVLLLLGMLAGCGRLPGSSGFPNKPADNPGTSADLGDDSTSFGESLQDLNTYAGYFEEDTADITVNRISGTEGCYTLDGNTLTFTAIGEDSVYSVSGKLKGNIVIDVGDDYKFDLQLQGLSLVSGGQCPLLILSGDEVSLTAKSGYENYIYDTREAVEEEDEAAYSGAISSLVDLELCGKGALVLVSENNNGIHGKDDLQVKNLTLTVACTDNALKGNDSVEITDATTTLIASRGDGIKTKNSDISEKGNQRGSVTVSGGAHSVYAACDGIDAAYNVVIDRDSTVLNIYTDKYSNYSSQVTAVDENRYYIRFTANSFQYSVKYYNSDSDYQWVNAEYHSAVSGGRSNYYYYAFPKLSQYSKMQFFIYSSDMTPGQDTDYLVASDYLTPSTGYDTFALVSQGNTLMYSWTNYTTNIQDGGWGRPGGMGGPGGMGEGNSDKGDYSTKGIKAGNEILISAGTVSIKAYDDAIHANAGTALKNGETSTGNITVSGGVVTVYSNDDGLHADGTLTVSSGTLSVTHSYEGLEGTNVEIAGGYVSVISSDDGINGTATAQPAITVSGGSVYIRCAGDGIDSNSRTTGIVFSGGKTVVISNSANNSAIDTEQGYTYTGGAVVAIMPSRGMTHEATNCQNFAGIGTKSTLTLNAGSFLTVAEDGKNVVSVKIPESLSATVIYLGSNSASISSAASAPTALDSNGVSWSK